MRRKAFLLVLSLLFISVLLVLGTRTQGASGSVLSSGPNGFSALRGAVEALGRDVELLDRPFSEASAHAALEGSVLVVSFPWQRAGERATPAAIEEHRQNGLPVLIAYSGGALAGSEEELLSDLGVELFDSFGFGPLNPLQWRKELREPQTLSYLEPDRPQPEISDQVLSQRLRRVPEYSVADQKGTEVLLWDDAGHPISLKRSQSAARGALYVVPASVFSNAHLGHAGNARFLVALAQQLPDIWVFDEYHHGLVSSEIAEDGTTRAFDAVTLQFALLYALAVLALARRFSPPWPAVVTHTSNHREFLQGIGMLHSKLGHAAAARIRLLERYRRYDPSFEVTESHRALAQDPTNDEAKAFLALARQLHRSPQSRDSRSQAT